ncbi:MAG: hypothetical protein V1873_07405 [Verrucomicrobiota bacterium]
MGTYGDEVCPEPDGVIEQKPVNRELESLRRRFVEAAGHFTQSLGIGRAVGQSYAHIYFSREPQSLQHLQDVLGISKGSASMVVRQLEQWGAVRRVWVRGDRKDYYEAGEEFGNVIRKVLLDMIGREMEVANGLMEEAESTLRASRSSTNGAAEDGQFFIDRVRKLQAFRGRVQRFWNSWILAMLLRRGPWKEKNKR